MSQTTPLSLAHRVLTQLHAAPGEARPETTGPASWRRVLPVALLGLLAAAFIVSARVGLPSEAEPLAPFEVGHEWGLHTELAERGVPIPDGLSPIGYDGQWFLGQAYDPLLLTDIPSTFDAPRYRSLRVLMPAAGWLLAAGQPVAVPYALLLLEVLAVGLGVAACARIVTAYGRSQWWGLVFAAIPGVLVGVRYGTAEPLGLALVALGISLVLSRRYAWAGLAFAGAALTKETYLAFAAGAAVYLAVDAYVYGGRWLRPAAELTVPGVAILFSWWAYVEVTLPRDDDNPHGALGRFEAPLQGWGKVLGTIVRGDYPRYHLIGAWSEVVLVATFGLLVAAVAVAAVLRRSLLAYLALGWGLFGLIIAGFLLERFASAQRALAPAVLAAALFLISTRRPATATAERTGEEAAGGTGEQRAEETTGEQAGGPAAGPG